MRLNLPGGTLAGKLAGAFSHLIDGVTVDYLWTPASPQLVIARNNVATLAAELALVKADLAALKALLIP